MQLKIYSNIILSCDPCFSCYRSDQSHLHTLTSFIRNKKKHCWALSSSICFKLPGLGGNTNNERQGSQNHQIGDIFFWGKGGGQNVGLMLTKELSIYRILIWFQTTIHLSNGNLSFIFQIGSLSNSHTEIWYEIESTIWDLTAIQSFKSERLAKCKILKSMPIRPAML